jgi:hypothetical protein
LKLEQQADGLSKTAISNIIGCTTAEASANQSTDAITAET